MEVLRRNHLRVVTRDGRVVQSERQTETLPFDPREINMVLGSSFEPQKIEGGIEFVFELHSAPAKRSGIRDIHPQLMLTVSKEDSSVGARYVDSDGNTLVQLIDVKKVRVGEENVICSQAVGNTGTFLELEISKNEGLVGLNLIQESPDPTPFVGRPYNPSVS